MYDLAAKRAQVGRQRVGDLLRAAAGNRPADGVARRAPSTRPNAALGRCSSGRIECAASRRRGPRARSPSKRRSARPRAERSARSPKRASAIGWRGSRERAEQRRREPVGVARPAAPSAAGTPRRPDRGPSAVSSTERSSTAAVPSSKRVGQRGRRVDPLQPVLVQRQRSRRTARRRPSGGSPSRRRGRSRAASARRSACRRRWCLRLQHQHRAAGARQRDRRRQAVRPGADDDRVVHSVALLVQPCPDLTRSYAHATCVTLHKRRGSRTPVAHPWRRTPSSYRQLTSFDAASRERWSCPGRGNPCPRLSTPSSVRGPRRSRLSPVRLLRPERLPGPVIPYSLLALIVSAECSAACDDRPPERSRHRPPGRRGLLLTPFGGGCGTVPGAG